MFRSDINVGLVGWGSCTGNGGWNFDLARLCDWIKVWVVPEHPVKGWFPPYVEDDAVLDKVQLFARIGSGWEINWKWLDGLDVVVVVEREYLPGLVEECHRYGVKVVYVPMWEWHKHGGWSDDVDAVWCVNRWTLEHVMIRPGKWKDVWVLPWGVAVESFPFEERKECKKFLFVNGTGGVLGRKGLEFIKKLDLPLVVKDQAEEEVRERRFLYEGDVLLAPSKWEGWGHQLYEAQSCGMPVLVTDAPPMNDASDVHIPVETKKWVNLAGKRIVSCLVDVSRMQKMCTALIGQDISEWSRGRREWIVKNHNLEKILPQLEEKIAGLF